MITWVRVGTLLAAVLAVVVMLLDLNPAKDLDMASRAYRAGNLDQTLRLASRALGLGSISGLDQAGRFRARELRARSAVRLGRPDFALAELDRALSERPGQVGALLLRGELRRDAGDLPGALKDLNRGLELAGESPPAASLVQRGRTLLDLGRKQEAWEDAVLAVKRDPRLPGARELASRVLAANGRQDLALKQAEIAFELLRKRTHTISSLESPEVQGLISWLIELRRRNKVSLIKPSS